MRPLTAPLAVVDTETTSLVNPWHPGGRRVWDVCVLHVDTDLTVTEALAVLVEDADITYADPAALRIGGYYARHPDYRGGLEDGYRAMTEKAAAVAVDEALAGRVLVAANPAFDAASLEHLLAGHGLVPRWHHRLVCVEAAAGTACGIPPGDGWGLRRLAAAAGLDAGAYQPAHTAVADAWLALDLLGRAWDLRWQV